MLVLIVDTSAQVMDRLEEIISEAENIRAVYKTVCYEEAIKLFKKNKPDAVVLDSGLPGNKSVDLLREFKKINAAAVVIVLSVHMDAQVQEQCSLLRADYFFDKYNDFEKIPGVINSITTARKATVREIFIPVKTGSS
jgi:DNA-binding NarL/FixJ family response regulator